MESWDDDNFEPAVVLPASSTKQPHHMLPTLLSGSVNKWEGEDEDDEVKESWEDEAVDESTTANDSTTRQTTTTKTVSKKKSLSERIAEKESRKREELARKLHDQQQPRTIDDDDDDEEITLEERKRRQKESDLKLALETTFGGDATNNNTITNNNGCIDGGGEGLIVPGDQEDFHEFTEMLSKKLLPLSKHTEYPMFVENLLRNLCATMSSLDVKKVKNTLDNFYLEKQRIEKGEKSRKNKGKGKAKLKMDDGNPLSAYTDDYSNDYDDFM